MAISEPMTAATDFVLALCCAIWGTRQLIAGRRARCTSRVFWGIGFLGFAAAALAGGLYHGVRDALSPTFGAGLWRAVVASMAVASAAMLAGATRAFVCTVARPLWFCACAAKLAIVLVLFGGSDDFTAVIVDYGIAQCAMFLLAASAWRRERNASASWILAGVAVSVIAAAIQQSGFAPHRHFDHNDLYHVVQLAGMYLFDRGGRKLVDLR